MQLSARNQIKGKVVEVKPGAVNSSVTLDIGNGNKINASITMESVQSLGLKVGDDAYAVIKASSVLIGKD
jgi:molybdenum-pterin binding domain